MRRSPIHALAAAAYVAATPALAWERPVCDHNDRGDPFCFVSTSLVAEPSFRRQEMSFALSRVANDTEAVVSLHDSSWRLAARSDVAASVATEMLEPVTRQAVSDGTSVLVSLTLRDLQRLAASRELVVNLPGVRARFALRGARAAIERLADAYSRFAAMSDPLT